MAASKECRDTRPRVSETRDLQPYSDGHPGRGVPTLAQWLRRTVDAGPYIFRISANERSGLVCARDHYSRIGRESR